MVGMFIILRRLVLKKYGLTLLYVKGHGSTPDGCKSAILNGDFHADIYMCQPLGFVDIGTSKLVYKLKTSLYQLKQAPRAWYHNIDYFFFASCLSFGQSNLNIYVEHIIVEILMIFLYDLIIMGSDVDMILNIKKKPTITFGISDLGFLCYFLGHHFLQLEHVIVISQHKYAFDHLERFCTDCKPYPTCFQFLVLTASSKSIRRLLVVFYI